MVEQEWSDTFVPLYDNESPFICYGQVGFSAGGYSCSPRSLSASLRVALAKFSGLSALMGAGIAWGLWSLVNSCLKSCRRFHLFPRLIFVSYKVLSALR